MKFLRVKERQRMGKLIKEIIKKNNFLKSLILKLYTKVWLKYRLKYQLSHKRASPSFLPYSGLKVFIPLVETSHYQHHQILGLGRILSDRGADVLVLVCDAALEACELKSVKNRGEKNPCFLCKLNQSHLLDLYGLSYITISEIKKQISSPCII